jgi:hypothetical protein
MSDWMGRIMRFVMMEEAALPVAAEKRMILVRLNPVLSEAWAAADINIIELN